MSFPLRGVNISYGSSNHEFQRADLELIKSMGFNTFRLRIYWNMIQPTNGTSINENIFTQSVRLNANIASLDNLVQWASELGLTAILNIATTSSYPSPLWTGLGSITSGAETKLFLDSIAPRMGLVYAFKNLAQRYASVSNIALELNNEWMMTPIYGTYLTAYKNFIEETIDSIRSVEIMPHIVMAPWLIRDGDWVEFLDEQPDVERSNFAWVQHSYTPQESYNPATQEAYVIGRVKRFSDWANAHGKRIYVTEVAKETNQTYWREWTKTVFDTMKSLRAVDCWLWHNYDCNPNTAEFYTVAKNRIPNQEILSVLQPYMGDLPFWKLQVNSNLLNIPFTVVKI